ncbi:tetratricopeptide repeat protein [Candidatus Avelusimicrobium alvi]|uniref:tetratricopeptide repeat protein n=1 Tax=Candidatus Avelusimicrobium alvi TaxID=3416221 RepID=UPI003D0B0ECF
MAATKKKVQRTAVKRAVKLDYAALEALLDAGRPSDALEKLSAARAKDAAAWFLTGEAQRQLGSFEDALKSYAKTLQTAEDAETRMDALLAMAACYRTLGHSAAAYELAEDALKMARELEYDEFTVRAMQEMGMALRAWGRLEEALDLLDAVLAAYTQLKDFAGMSFIHWAKGGIFRLQGHFEEGIAQFKKAVSLAKKAGDDISLAYGYCGLAGISRICGKIDDCVKYYKLAEKIFRKSEDVFGKAYTNCGMANGLRQQGRYDEALRHYNVADKLYSAINDTVDLGFVKWGRADILKRKNKMAAALEDLQQARALFDNSDETRGQILTKLALAQVLYALGRTEEAEELYDAGVSQARAEGLHTYLESYT